MSVKIDRLNNAFVEKISEIIHEEVKDNDVKMVTSAADLVKKLTGRSAKVRARKQVRQITLEQQNILNIMKNDEIHFDDLVVASGLSVAQLSTLLTNMEMIGLIEKLPGNYLIAK